ncbi:hypothetical protein P7C73_g5700, partial [Tremellales sp. Uapishka_1]
MTITAIVPTLNAGQPLLSSASRRVSYGTTTPSPDKGKSRAADADEDEDEESEDGEAIIDVTWKHMSRLYLLVPIITLIFLGLLVILVTFAWPPNKKERRAGQRYPHPIFIKPFLIGVFASCTVQTIRVPTWVISSWLSLPRVWTTILSTFLHTTLHELLRLASVTLTTASPSSGFHSSYYLGLGWGVAEVAYGIVQGWEQLALYEDAMSPVAEDEEAPADDERSKMESGLSVVREEVNESEVILSGETTPEGEGDGELEREQAEDEAELERKVEILERMRGRRELEHILGLPFPNIPFPLHLLWRLDTLLLNLGLTLVLSAFYYDPSPIYRHFYPSPTMDPTYTASHTPNATEPAREPSPYLWLVWAFVVVLHTTVSLVWKVVGRLGVGAVTWGGLIVALGSVFAGLGAWGGLV